MSCPLKPKNPKYAIRNHLQKGCVFWFDLEENIDPKISSNKARLYIILNKYSQNSPRIIISPITDRIHCVENKTDKLKYPNNAPINKIDNSFLDKDSVVLLDQVYTISKAELYEEWFVGQIINMLDIDKAIMYNYNLFESIHATYAELLQLFPSTYKEQYTRT